jgi:hypothetical protein
MRTSHFCLRFQCSRLQRIVIANVGVRNSRLIVAVKKWDGLANIRPVCKTLAPPFIILGYGMVLRQIECNDLRESSRHEYSVVRKMFTRCGDRLQNSQARRTSVLEVFHTIGAVLHRPGLGCTRAPLKKRLSMPRPLGGCLQRSPAKVDGLAKAGSIDSGDALPVVIFDDPVLELRANLQWNPPMLHLVQ